MFYSGSPMIGLIPVMLMTMAGLILWYLCGRGETRSNRSIPLGNVLDLLLVHASYLCSLADRAKAGEVLSPREQRILDSSIRSLQSIALTGFTTQEFSNALVSIGKAVPDDSP